MKISNLESSRAGQITSVNPTNSVVPSTAPAQTPTQGDGPAAQVELSAQAQTLSAAKTALDSVPETRDDLVAKLKSQIDAGTYKVSGADIAEQMLRRAKADRIA